jgi:hypothetical protein
VRPHLRSSLCSRSLGGNPKLDAAPRRRPLHRIARLVALLGGSAHADVTHEERKLPMKFSRFDRRTARILKHQRHAVVVVRQRDWSRRPVSVKFGLERIFVLKPLDATERGFFNGNKQDRGPLPEPR